MLKGLLVDEPQIKLEDPFEKVSGTGYNACP
jgi:hypothetical protein